MTDRPNLGELLDAVRLHIESALLPAIRPEPRLYYQTLVALNLLKIAQRELLSGQEILRLEWEAINQLTRTTLPPPDRSDELTEALRARNQTLCDTIRSGAYDNPADASRLLSFLEPVVNAQLIMNNPGLARRIGEEIIHGTYAE